MKIKQETQHYLQNPEKCKFYAFSKKAVIPVLFSHNPQKTIKWHKN